MCPRTKCCIKSKVSLLTLLFVYRFLQTAEMLKPSTPSASHDSTGSSGSDDGAEYYPHIGDIYLFNSHINSQLDTSSRLTTIKIVFFYFVIIFVYLFIYIPPPIQCFYRIRPDGKISAQGIWKTCIWSWTNWWPTLISNTKVQNYKNIFWIHNYILFMSWMFFKGEVI